MSFFHDNVERIKNAIQYFNKLDYVRKAILVGNVSDAVNVYSADELENVQPIISAIEQDLITHSEITIANKITELGMENTYSQLFVKNIVEQRPPIEYRLNILQRMDESNFKDIFIDTITKFYFDIEQKEELLTKWKLTDQQFSAIIMVYGEAVREILRGETTNNAIRKKCNATITSEKKVNAIIESINTTSQLWWNRLVFSNTQDTHFTMQEVIEQNRTILETLREILEILRSNK